MKTLEERCKEAGIKTAKEWMEEESMGYATADDSVYWRSGYNDALAECFPTIEALRARNDRLVRQKQSLILSLDGARNATGEPNF